MQSSRWTILFGILLTVFESSAVAQLDSVPNILFIYTDDQAAWAVGSSGNSDVHTPTMDRLFAEGATLTNCFVTTPVCSPSRVGLLTSRYGTEMGITDWINPRGGEYQRRLGRGPCPRLHTRGPRDRYRPAISNHAAPDAHGPVVHQLV